jgi:hypothetical protein
MSSILSFNAIKLIEVEFEKDWFHQKLTTPMKALYELKSKWMKAVFAINDVFVKYNMHQHFSLALLHRHHNLQDDERLVEIMYDDRSVTEPMIPNRSFESIPHIWMVQEGRLWPFEYLDITSSKGIDAEHLKACYLRLLHDVSFISELTEILEITGTKQVLGLQLVHREGLRRADEFLSESSNQLYRQSIVVSTTELDVCDVPVTWMMGPDRTFCENCIPEQCFQQFASDKVEDSQKVHNESCAKSNCGCGTCCWKTHCGDHCRSHRET